MNQGKAKVIGEVLKQQGMFKAARIVTATGLSQQLVYHHLKALVADGYLEKDGTKYGVVARQDLIDSLINIGENNVLGLFPISPHTRLFNKETMNEFIELTVMLRAARIVGHDEMKSLATKELDSLVAQCKSAKRYLNSKTMSEKKAAKKLYTTFDEAWELIRQVVKVDRQTMFDQIAEKVDNVD